MALNNAYSQYAQNSVLTASPEELTFMLYNGLVKFIMVAQKAVDENDMEKAHNSIVRAQDIILEFQITLDKKYDIAESLMLLYEYMNRRLIDANVKKDRQILEEVLGLAKDMRDTWGQAMKIARRQPYGEQKLAK